MALITRASLPEEFFDITSAQLLLQPEPQYLHAQLAKMAVAKDLDLGVLGLSPARAIPSMGKAYASVGDGRLTLSDGIYDQAVTAVAELGNAPGHTIRMNRPKFTDSTYTLASREVPAGSTISVTPLDVSSEQVAITIRRFAGPFGASVVQPYSVDRFDATMSIHKLAAIVGLHMKRDFDKWLDTVMVTLYNTVASANQLWPNGMTADNDSTVAGDFPMDLDLLFRAESALDAANIPRFANGRRLAIVTPRQALQLKSDNAYQRLAVYEPEKNPLFTSYVASVGNIDICWSNTLDQANNSSSVPIHKAQMLAPGMVGMGVGEMPRVAASSDDMYGEQAKVVWLMYAGFAVLDNRFAISMRTS